MRLLPSNFLLLYLITFLLLSINAHSAEVLCMEKEKQALLDFKLSFVGDPFGVLSTWTIHNADCCEWGGVGCGIDGHVTSLDLGSNFMTSYKLRRSLLELQHLTSLNLNRNQFTMRIPEFIGSLRKLINLDLSESGFFGEIPPHLGNLSRLESLHLGQSNGLFANNLQWLARLSFIQDVDFSNVDLSNAIDWASTLKKLPVLCSFICRSCSLPRPPLSFLSHVNSSIFLQTLDLSNNSMSSSTFSFMINGTTTLQSLSLDYMKLEGKLDEFLEALSGGVRYVLEVLSLVGNNLSKLPFQVAKFPSLIRLDASFNKINRSLSEILHYLPKDLGYLCLSTNLLNGVVSDAHFSKFLNLQSLDLSYNNLLTFNFSEGWVPPFQLYTISLRSCQVGPTFPNWILTQKHLSEIDISNSMISSAIPNGFWYINNHLSSLNLSHNKINCEIPNLSLNFTGMVVDLSSNTFHGPIPLFLFTTNMLDLSNNRFSCFPSFHPRVIGQGLELINLSGNHLSGSLPIWLFRLDGLYILNLENNMLSGTLPEEIGSLWLLGALHLTNNRFSGHLPLSIVYCTHLTILELANNNFSGVLPSWLGESMTQLIVLTLRANDFSGDMPFSLCHLQSLQMLDLSDNRLSGTIPTCLHNYSSMATNEGLRLTFLDEYKLSAFITNGYVTLLDYASVLWKGALADLYKGGLLQRNVINLSGNGLRGEIPVGLTTLKELKSLDLSRNHLNGSIPDKIGQLTSLELLKLSSNRLSGEIPESLAGLTFLGTLNLSDNDLFGRIPSSTQLQSFNASSYDGNPKLCGEPLPTKCPGDEDTNKKQPLLSKDARDESFDIQAFLAALGTGFAFGLLGILGALHFNRQFRLALFHLIHEIADRIFVATSLYKSKIKRSLNLP